MRNFLGHDGFIWWVGIVENIQDPLNIGRCKVRCFGYHPEKETDLVPTDDLPWATSIHPTNTANLYASLKVGDWVFGFFLDGLSAQEPAILGYFPTVPDTSERNFSDKITATRNFNRVNTANNSSNTVCWEIGENIIEVVVKSQTEANGHILIQHKTGAKINIESNGKISIYTPTNDISIKADNGDINLNAKNINLIATEAVSVVSGLATSVVAGGLVSVTAGGAFTATAGLYASIRALAGELNLQSSAFTNITASGVNIIAATTDLTGLLDVAGTITGAVSVTAPIVTTGTVGLGTHVHGGVKSGGDFSATGTG